MQLVPLRQTPSILKEYARSNVKVLDYIYKTQLCGICLWNMQQMVQQAGQSTLHTSRQAFVGGGSESVQQIPQSYTQTLKTDDQDSKDCVGAHEYPTLIASGRVQLMLSLTRNSIFRPFGPNRR